MDGYTLPHFVADVVVVLTPDTRSRRQDLTVVPHLPLTAFIYTAGPPGEMAGQIAADDVVHLVAVAEGQLRGKAGRRPI